MATKVAVACFINAFLFVYFDIDRGYWSVLATLMTMLSNLDTGSFEHTLRAGIDRIIGTITGASIGLCMHHLMIHSVLVQSLWFLPFIIFIVVYFCVRLALRFGMFRLSAMTAILVMMLGLNEPSVQGIAFIRAGQILLGVIIAVIVTLMLWPYREKDQLDVLVHELLVKFRSWHEGVVDAIDRRSRGQSLSRPVGIESLFRSIESSFRTVKSATGLKYRAYALNDYTRLVSLLHQIDETLSVLARTSKIIAKGNHRGSLIIDIGVLTRLLDQQWEIILSHIQNDFDATDVGVHHEVEHQAQTLIDRLECQSDSWCRDGLSVKDSHEILSFSFSIQCYGYQLKRLDYMLRAIDIQSMTTEKTPDLEMRPSEY